MRVCARRSFSSSPSLRTQQDYHHTMMAVLTAHFSASLAFLMPLACECVCERERLAHSDRWTHSSVNSLNQRLASLDPVTLWNGGDLWWELIRLEWDKMLQKGTLFITSLKLAPCLLSWAQYTLKSGSWAKNLINTFFPESWHVWCLKFTSLLLNSTWAIKTQ